MAATPSTFRRTIGHDSPEVNLEIPFHGSCSRCHHFHNNHLFTFSPNSTVHTRLFCQSCNHAMFGLGRTSTQTTLASVESDFTFTPRACVDQSGPQLASQAEAVPGSPVLGLLTTITERKSPATSRSTSHIRTPVTTLTATPAGEEYVESRDLPKDTAPRSPEERALHLQTPTLHRLRTIGRRFKQRFSAKSREWRLSRIRLHITKTIESPHDAPEPSATPSAGPNHPDGYTTGTTDAAFASASTTEISSGQQRSNNAEDPVDGIGDDTEDRHASLRARRRELSLAREREATSIQKCECGPECPCISGSCIAQVGSAESSVGIHDQSSSTGSSNSQPSQSVSPGLYLSHIGCHFDSSRRSSSADESSSAAEGCHRRIRLSQCSIPRSNGSSVSLRARPPPIGRASSMPVGTRAQHLFGVRTSLHINRPESARATRSLNEGTVPGRASRTGSARDDETPSHESSTSLTNPLDPQEEDQLIDGVSLASHAPTRDGRQVSSAPHGGIQGGSDAAMPVVSDGLSSALQDLANRGTIYYEGHSPEV